MLETGARTLLAMLLALSSWMALAQGAAQGFVPEQVFAGRSEGRGMMKLLFGAERSFTVESQGTMQPDGSFRLDQAVRLEGQPVQTRYWLMRQLAPGRYEASLSDAAGPVEIGIEGSRLTLSYPIPSGLTMHQTLDLAADGRTVVNQARITFIGIPVGRLRETIERTP